MHPRYQFLLASAPPKKKSRFMEPTALRDLRTTGCYMPTSILTVWRHGAKIAEKPEY